MAAALCASALLVALAGCQSVRRDRARDVPESDGGVSTPGSDGGGSTPDLDGGPDTEDPDADVVHAGFCGDGEVDEGEVCDDAGPSATCDADCSPAQCGDGTHNPAAGEECDDGDRTSGDGCSSTCEAEIVTCGDGTCDMAHAETCVACPSDCAADPICVAAACGNGRLDGGEGCDDGNRLSGDGCSDGCVSEPGYTCRGTPSTCARPASIAGDVVVTEVMKDPIAVADSAGEWIEIASTRDYALDLTGVVVRDDGFDAFTITDAVVLPPHGRAVLGVSANPATNGGVAVTFQYAGLMLANTSDEVVLVRGTTVLDRFAYDDVSYPSAPGHALSLDPVSTSDTGNDTPDGWCQAARTYGSGDFGTPGALNPDCPGPFVFTRTPGRAIPDDTPAGIVDSHPIEATGCIVARVSVSVSITHTYRGDLIVELRPPSGSAIRVHDREGGSAEDLIATYDIDPFAAIAGTGTWSLVVSDNEAADVGTLDAWGMTIRCR